MTSSWRDGFLPQTSATIADKIALLRRGGAHALHCVFDFDHTLTTGIKAGFNPSTWGVLESMLPPDGYAEAKAKFEFYRPKELDGTMTDKDAKDWSTNSFTILTRYGLNLHEAEERFMQHAKLRDGTVELFDTCRRAGIPVVVMSAGIAQIIELLCNRHDIRPDLILSTEVSVDARGTIIGWNPATQIHARNKKELKHPELNAWRQSRPNVLMLGDIFADLDMVEAGESTLCIRVMDKTIDKGIVEADYAAATVAAGYDLIVDYSLDPVDRLVNFIANA
jgi:HAD superfamily phosphoserine phosphatase-like hydrolase